MNLLFSMLIKRKALVMVSICGSILTAAVTLLWNSQLSIIVNMVSAGTSPYLKTIMFTIVIMLIMGATNYFKGYISGYTCEYITHDLRMGYARHHSSLSFIEVEGLNTGEQLSKLQNEISGVSGYLNANLFQLLDDAVRFVTTFIWLLLVSPKLTLAANIPVFILLIYVFWSSKAIGSATLLSQQAKAGMNQNADTLLALFPIIRLYDAINLSLGGYRVAVESWERQTIRAERLRARLMSLSAILSSIPLMLLFLVGGHMVINGVLTVGTLYIFLNLSGNVSGVLMNMPGYIGAFRQFSANMKRLEGKICL